MWCIERLFSTLNWLHLAKNAVMYPRGTLEPSLYREYIRYLWVRIRVVTRYIWGALQWWLVIAICYPQQRNLEWISSCNSFDIFGCVKLFWYFCANFGTRGWNPRRQKVHVPPPPLRSCIHHSLGIWIYRWDHGMLGCTTPTSSLAKRLEGIYFQISTFGYEKLKISKAVVRPLFQEWQNYRGVITWHKI